MTDNGNSLISSLLIVNFAEISNKISLDFRHEMHTEFVPYRILDYNVIGSEGTVLQYYFIQNSNHLGAISFVVTNDDVFSRIKSRYVAMGGDFIVTRNSTIRCSYSNQELTIECLFYTESDRQRIIEVTMTFSFDEENIVSPNSEYSLEMPNGF